LPRDLPVELRLQGRSFSLLAGEASLSKMAILLRRFDLCSFGRLSASLRPKELRIGAKKIDLGGRTVVVMPARFNSATAPRSVRCAPDWGKLEISKKMSRIFVFAQGDSKSSSRRPMRGILAAAALPALRLFDLAPGTNSLLPGSTKSRLARLLGIKPEARLLSLASRCDLRLWACRDARKLSDSSAPPRGFGL